MSIKNPRYVDARKIYDQEAQTEADARAKMLIYLVKNKFVTLYGRLGIIWTKQEGRWIVHEKK